MLDPRWKDFSYLQRFLYQNHTEALSLLNRLEAFETKRKAYMLLHEQYEILSINTSSSSSPNLHDEQKKQTIRFIRYDDNQS